MKILFMGTPDFSRESLEKLYNSDKHEIIGVVTTPDRPAGRGMKLIASPVKEFALEKNLKLFQPEKIANNEEFKS
ncbi:MAG: methionyl-tRNA formyltransferase, partial [Clostridia bacterium]|nr:methionyl-tRNA formyltransferase [Clostridia bacterium]